MKTRSQAMLLAALFGLLLAAVALLAAWPVLAQEPPDDIWIELRQEPGGDIDAGAPAAWDGVYENLNGGMVWNGSEWIVNNTWAHEYFIDLHTGQKLYPHTLAGTFDGSGAPNVTVVQGYTVTQAIYTYTVPASTGRAFSYAAIEYRITQPDGRGLILRSRGCGLGIAQAYLDIYIQNPAGEQVTAFRGDPIMYGYDASLEEAVLMTDASQEARASLPTAAPYERARYWLDVNNGSDLGGYTYTFRTQALDCQTRNLGTSFPGEFQIQYFDDASGGVVQEIRFLPKLVRERLAYSVYLPFVGRNW